MEYHDSKPYGGQNSPQIGLDFINLVKPTYRRQNLARQGHGIDVFSSGKFVDIVERNEQRAHLARAF